jgi:hypothetical protein
MEMQIDTVVGKALDMFAEGIEKYGVEGFLARLEQVTA